MSECVTGRGDIVLLSLVRVSQGGEILSLVYVLQDIVLLSLVCVSQGAKILSYCPWYV